VVGEIGTQNHCIHGKNASREEILGWRPFDYYIILKTCGWRSSNR
jgi:hypothetical protein